MIQIQEIIINETTIQIDFIVGVTKDPTDFYTTVILNITSPQEFITDEQLIEAYRVVLDNFEAYLETL